MHYKSRKLLLIVQMEILYLDSVHSVICKTEAALYYKQVFFVKPIFQ